MKNHSLEICEGEGKFINYNILLWPKVETTDGQLILITKKSISIFVVDV